MDRHVPLTSTWFHLVGLHPDELLHEDHVPGVRSPILVLPRLELAA